MPGMMSSVMPGMMMSHMSQASMQPALPVILRKYFSFDVLITFIYEIIHMYFIGNCISFLSASGVL